MPDAPVIELERHYIGDPPARSSKRRWRHRLSEAAWVTFALLAIGFVAWVLAGVAVSGLQPDIRDDATPAEYLDASGLSWRSPQLVVDDPVGSPAGVEDSQGNERKLMFPVYLTINGVEGALEVPLGRVKGVPGAPAGGRIIMTDDGPSRIDMLDGYWDCGVWIPRPSACKEVPARFDPAVFDRIRSNPSEWIEARVLRIEVQPDDLPPRP
jgi:hypothetical protein